MTRPGSCGVIVSKTTGSAFPSILPTSAWSITGTSALIRRGADISNFSSAMINYITARPWANWSRCSNPILRRSLAASARVIMDGRSRVVDVYRSLAHGIHKGRNVITRCFLENGRNIVGEPSAVLFRKADARRGFDPKYRHIVDVEMWFHLLEKGGFGPTPASRCAPSVAIPARRPNTTSAAVSVSRMRVVFCRLRPAVAASPGSGLSTALSSAPLASPRTGGHQFRVIGLRTAADGLSRHRLGPFLRFLLRPVSHRQTLPQPPPFHRKTNLSLARTRRRDGLFRSGDFYPPTLAV